MSQKKKNTKKGTKRTSLTLSLALIIFGAFIIVFALSLLAIFILSRFNVIQSGDGKIDITDAVLFFLVFILGVGGIFSFVISKLALIPINKTMNKINDLASGDFTSRLELGELGSKIPAFQGLTDAFNKLAAELQNTEMLRSDFINNFSHEFKTPIVSITGFAKLLKRDNLTEEQREQYIKAIEEESLRLSAMATNVLNLTKIENQSILSSVSKYNVSEQIRSSILLLESKWTKKNIDLAIDLDEVEITANEELLKHVFINLIDNAIKFSNDNGKIEMRAKANGDKVVFSITNFGFEISTENIPKIFNKFYQVDKSHSTEGNGIGLAIVKRVVDLHGGVIEVISENMSVTFTVTLPKNQKH